MKYYNLKIYYITNNRLFEINFFTVCLSTVDRRSRERFVESNAQIVALVEKFKMEGAPYRKSSAMSVLLGSPPSDHQPNSHPYPYSAQGSSTTQIGMTLYQ